MRTQSKIWFIIFIKTLHIKILIVEINIQYQLTSHQIRVGPKLHNHF